MHYIYICQGKSYANTTMREGRCAIERARPEHMLATGLTEKAAERIAAAERTSLNQFINVAVAEKLSALETATYFRSRATKGRREAFLSFLDEAGDEAPGDGDKAT